MPCSKIAANEPRHATAAEAVAAFYSEGWREQLAATLRPEFAEPLGHDAILDAVDGALETALTRLKPEPLSDPPVYSGRMVFALAKTVAWRRMRDQMRRMEKWAARSAARDLDGIAEIPDCITPSPEDVSLCSERTEVIREAAAGLDEQTLLVLSLFHVEGFKKPQIQRLLGLSEHAVRTYLRRGNEYLLERYLAIEAGKSCEGKAGPVRLAFDLARGADARRARAHVRHCRECARHYRRALAYRRAVAGLCPVPVGLTDPCAADVFAIGNAFLDRARHLTRHAFDSASFKLSSTVRGANSVVHLGAELLTVGAAGVALLAGAHFNGVNDPGASRISPTDSAARVHSAAGAGPKAMVSVRDEHTAVARSAASHKAAAQRRNDAPGRRPTQRGATSVARQQPQPDQRAKLPHPINVLPSTPLRRPPGELVSAPPPNEFAAP